MGGASPARVLALWSAPARLATGTPRRAGRWRSGATGPTTSAAKPLDGGHFFPEELPAETAEALERFFDPQRECHARRSAGGTVQVTRRSAPLPPVDHLVWGGRVLDEEIDRLEALLGVRASPEAGIRAKGRTTRSSVLGRPCT